MGIKRNAFVIMPFKEPYNSYYNQIFKPALEAANFLVSRIDDLFTPRPIIMDIQQSICEADLILCEMSERNPNVFYELGLAHAIGKPTILIARKEDDIPFDLSHIRTLIYDRDYPSWDQKLSQSITAASKTINDSNETWPPPLLNKTHQITDELIISHLEKLIVREREQENKNINVILKNGNLEVKLPLRLRRADLSRAEILGRVGMIPMKEKGRRFSLKYLSNPEFLDQLNQIRTASHEADILTILCTEEEMAQFDL